MRASARADSLPGVSKPLETIEPKTPVPQTAPKARKSAGEREDETAAAVGDVSEPVEHGELP